MTDETDDSIIREAQARLDLEPLANKLSFSSDLLKERALDLAARKVAERRRERKKVKLKAQLKWAVSQVVGRKEHTDRADAGDVDAEAAVGAPPELTDLEQLQVTTAAWLKREYAKIRGCAWRETDRETLHRMREIASQDQRHLVEKRAVSVAKKFREALLEVRELAEADPGGPVWSLLVNRIEPETNTEAFDILVDTTDSELDGIAGDEASLSDQKARFGVNYKRHRALARWLEKHPKEHADWMQGHKGEMIASPLDARSTERLPDDVGPRELAIAWLLSGLVEDERQGVMLPVSWDTWPSGKAGTPQEVVKRTSDAWKNNRGTGARQQAENARESMRKALED